MEPTSISRTQGLTYFENRRDYKKLFLERKEYIEIIEEQSLTLGKGLHILINI